MITYLDVLQQVMEFGSWHENRTGIRTKRISGRHLYFDMRQGFPIVTTKEINFTAIKAELIAFLRGASNASVFRGLGTKIWDDNANLNGAWLSNPYRKGRDDLGPIYGVQWRSWPLPSHAGHIDQLAYVVQGICEDPDSRRLLVSAWNVAALPQMALPPCHVIWQVMPDKTTGEIDLCVYLRSWDLFLGGPFNIASYGLLLELLARGTGYKARWLNVFAADVHIYENHFEQAKMQMERSPYPLPKLIVANLPQPKGTKVTDFDRTPYIESADVLKWLVDDLEPWFIDLEGYKCHGAIRAPMAI